MKRRIVYGFIMISLILMNAMTALAADAPDVVPGAVAANETGINWMLVIIVALIVAAIACAVASGSMKSVHTAISAKRYEKEGSFTLTDRADQYINTTQQRIHHERR